MRFQIRLPEPVRAYYDAYRVPALGILYGAGVLVLTCLFGVLLTIGGGSSAGAEDRDAWHRELEAARARSRVEPAPRMDAVLPRAAPAHGSSLGVRDYVVQVREGTDHPQPDPFIPPELIASPAGIDGAAAFVDEPEPPPDPPADVSAPGPVWAPAEDIPGADAPAPESPDSEGSDPGSFDPQMSEG